jgi:hypothetical protein
MPHRTPPRLLSLEPLLRCPNRRCGEIVLNVNPEMGTSAVYRCERKKCRSHWWAKRLEPGDVRAQLLVDYEDPDIVDWQMRLWKLPDTIPRSMYWQVWLSGEEFHSFNTDQSTGRLGRSTTLFQKMIDIYRRASA